MEFSAVLFDLGQTLLDYGPAGRWPEFRLRRMKELYPLAQELWGPLDLSAGEFGRRVGAGIQTEETREREHRGFSVPFSERLTQALAGVGIKAAGEALARFAAAFSEPIREWPQPYPETRAVLERLPARLAIITNAPWDSPGELLRSDLARWGLADHFAAFVGSGEVPWRKPHPEFMWEAARALACAPEQCLVVGDNLAADIAGAHAAGMRSLWVNREGMALGPEAPPPDWTAASLELVLELTGG